MSRRERSKVKASTSRDPQNVRGVEEPTRNTGYENHIITMMMRMMEQQNKLMEGIAQTVVP